MKFNDPVQNSVKLQVNCNNKNENRRHELLPDENFSSYLLVLKTDFKRLSV